MVDIISYKCSEIRSSPPTLFLKNINFYFFIWLCSVLVAACRGEFPDQGLVPGPWLWEHGVLAIGPPGKSPPTLLCSPPTLLCSPPKPLLPTSLKVTSNPPTMTPKTLYDLILTTSLVFSHIL